MSLSNKKILMFVENQYEDLELQYPKYRLMEEGAKVIIAGPKANEFYHGYHGYPCQADIALDSVNVNDFTALIIPGGYAPDKLRKLPKVQEITKEFNKQEKLIAFICHAGWIPISANILKGVRCTSYGTIKDDIVNAGGNWVDEAVVKDRHFISSRSPLDLPKFCPAILQYLAQEETVGAKR